MGKYSPGKLNDVLAREIRVKYFTTKTSTRKLATEYGVSHQAIFFVINGSTHVPGLESKRKKIEEYEYESDY